MAIVLHTAAIDSQNSAEVHQRRNELHKSNDKDINIDMINKKHLFIEFTEDVLH